MTLSFPGGKQEGIPSFWCLWGLQHMTIHKEKSPLLWVLSPSFCLLPFPFSSILFPSLLSQVQFLRTQTLRCRALCRNFPGNCVGNHSCEGMRGQNWEEGEVELSCHWGLSQRHQELQSWDGPQRCPPWVLVVPPRLGGFVTLGEAAPFNQGQFLGEDSASILSSRHAPGSWGMSNSVLKGRARGPGAAPLPFLSLPFPSLLFPWPWVLTRLCSPFPRVLPLILFVPWDKSVIIPFHLPPLGWGGIYKPITDSTHPLLADLQ